MQKDGGAFTDIGATLFTIAKAYNHNIPGAKAKFAEIKFGLLQGIAIEAIAEVQIKSRDKQGGIASCNQLKEILVKALNAPTKLLLRTANLQHENGDTAGSQATVALVMDTARKKDDDEAMGLLSGTQAAWGDMEGALKTLALIKKASEQANARKYIATARAKSGAVATAPLDADAFCQTEVLAGVAMGILESLKLLAVP